MKNEREDWEAPEIPQPTKLSTGEQIAVFREMQRGADPDKLARYWNTTVADIRQAHREGKRKAWK